MDTVHQNREPVSTYGEAVSWLFRYSDVPEWAFDRERDLPPEAQLVCDMFWISPSRLVSDVRQLWNETASHRSAPAPYRRANRGGWR